ncbi:MAG: hypothetical protein VYD08_03035, partial [Pseudomonadota bacterium]|nr:hypothetical protein [Pseudomonadota bacterium]
MSTGHSLKVAGKNSVMKMYSYNLHISATIAVLGEKAAAPNIRKWAIIREKFRILVSGANLGKNIYLWVCPSFRVDFHDSKTGLKFSMEIVALWPWRVEQGT